MGKWHLAVIKFIDTSRRSRLVAEAHDAPCGKPYLVGPQGGVHDGRRTSPFSMLSLRAYVICRIYFLCILVCIARVFVAVSLAHRAERLAS